MKANVAPAPPWLAIPAWVPDAIVQWVEAAYVADLDRVYEQALREDGYFDDDDLPRELIDELIRDAVNRANVAHLVHDELAEITDRYVPLACDRRMEGVWRELSRQRSSGGFLHPAREQQDAAMLELFRTALACRQQYGRTTIRGELEQQREDCLAKAEELRDDAIMMLVRSPHGSERYQSLMDAAQAYEDHAGEISFAGALERKHDGRGRWVALTIGNTFQRLFGSPMYRLTARITSVILGREIDPRTVRKWCDNLPHPAL
jgi:hypothetical protein